MEIPFSRRWLPDVGNQPLIFHQFGTGLKEKQGFAEITR